MNRVEKIPFTQRFTLANIPVLSTPFSDPPDDASRRRIATTRGTIVQDVARIMQIEWKFREKKTEIIIFTCVRYFHNIISSAGTVFKSSR